MARFDKFSLQKGLRRLRFFAGNSISYHVPDKVYRLYLRCRFAFISANLKAEGEQRVNYYIRLCKGAKVDPTTATRVGDYKYPRKSKHKFVTYFYDLYRSIRCFDRNFEFSYLFGDVAEETPSPTFVKSRPIVEDEGTTNSVLCPLNRVRHMVFVNDPDKWESKRDQLVFRNYVIGQPHRTLYLERTIGSRLCDSGQINPNPEHPEYVKPYMPMADMLKYKFIACIEGNDVATNLKWVMSSNSIAVMPKPRIESWFMEGKLIANYHYIEVKDDYSDIEERLQYYLDNPNEAKTIIANANEYARKFRKPIFEHWIENQVVKKYFEETGQYDKKA